MFNKLYHLKEYLYPQRKQYDMSNFVFVYFAKDISPSKSKWASVNVTYFADIVYLLSVTLSTFTDV